MNPTRIVLPAAAFCAGLAVLLVARADEKAETSDAPSAAVQKAPATFTDSTPYPAEHPLPAMNRMFVTERVHEIVNEKGGPATEAEMQNYEETVPRADNKTLKMIAIKGGEFLFGSPEDEFADTRDEEEGPQVKVKIEPFWMAQTEIPWALYKPFYENGQARKKDGTLASEGEELANTGKGETRKKIEAAKLSIGDQSNVVDVISQPTPQYNDMFLSGELPSDSEYPAMTMTHHAASKWCQWLSAQTGHFYRLPTEAEWEYACRAGTTSAFHFGDDLEQLDDYAWHGYNSEFSYQPVGKKKANPWGLHDMHGNVAEWVLDGYAPGFRKSLKDGVLNPWSIPITRYPRMVKGGSWDQEKEECRSAARLRSSNDWKEYDPQVPKSVWYHTSAQHIGFRVVRPLKTPTAEEMHLYWNTDWWEPKRNAEDL